MQNLAKALYVLAISLTFGVSNARAQAASPATQKAFVNVNFGAQLADRSLGFSSQQTIYDETATFSSNMPISGGALFDFGAGYRVYGDIYAGIVFSWFSDTTKATWNASIPHPLFFNRPLAREGTDPNDLERKETTFSPNITYAHALTDKMDIAAGIGLSITSVSQDVVSTFTVPAGTQDVITSVTATDGTATGVYAAVDLIYNLIEYVGVGGYVRYSGGKADLEDASGNVVVAGHNVGGMQAGGGVRLRF